MCHSAVFVAFLFPGTCIYAQTVKATYPANKQVIAKGESLFQQNCASCHSFTQRGIGPDLAGVTTEVSSAYLTKFIINPEHVIQGGNKRAVALFKEYKVPMPAHSQLTGTDINAILAFIHTHKKQGSKQDAARLGAAIENPIPAKIAKAGLTLKLEEYATAPATSAKIPLARINQLTELKGQRSRMFINDLRGPLYELKDKKFDIIWDISKLKPAFICEPGFGNGLGSYAFHPDFNKNGLFYTTHTEKKGSGRADFTYADSIPVMFQWVLTEWEIEDSASFAVTGEGRELLRLDVPTQMHGVQQITFNPLSKPGDNDYALLYIGIGDCGSAEHGFSHLCNSNTQIRGSVLRIDPAGRNSANGRYGIPAINPYAKDNNPNTLGEIFARGFRNPNRITWAADGKMLISDIGLVNVEELNLGIAGTDYGWPARERTFLLNYKGRMDKVYALPDHDGKYTYPVAQYDHDEGNSISSGFVYDGDIALLKGKYIFGDIFRGRVFYVESDKLKLGQQAVIKEFDLQFGNTQATFLDVVKNAKADLRFGIGQNNVLYIFTKTDGKMWKVADCMKN